MKSVFRKDFVSAPAATRFSPHPQTDKIRCIDYLLFLGTKPPKDLRISQLAYIVQGLHPNIASPSA